MYYDFTAISLFLFLPLISTEPVQPATTTAPTPSRRDLPATNATSSPTPYNRTAPEDCPPGYYCPWSTDLYYLPSPDNATDPVPCPAGTYRDLPGGRSAVYCIPCPPATYSPLLAATTCLFCPLYRACASAGLITPGDACVVGAYEAASPEQAVLNASGATTLLPNCAPCPPGHSCPSPANHSGPVECAPGTYQDTYATSACAACAQGQYSTLWALAEACPLCDAGSYCPTPTERYACPSGTDSEPGISDLSQCTCANGNQCVFLRQLLIRLTLYNTTRLDLTPGFRTRFEHAMALSTGTNDEDVQILDMAVLTRRRAR